MKRYPIFIMMILASLILSACGQLFEPNAGTPTPNTDIQPTNAGGMPAAVGEARAVLAARLGLQVDEIQVVNFQAKQWPDSCLGTAPQGEMCSQVIVPGYGGVFLAGGVSYEFRTNEEGDILRILPGAVLRARQFLAQQLSASLDAIHLSSYSSVEWPDACLGIEQEGQVCAQVLTPGYMIMLEYNRQVYEVRSDITGETVLMAAAIQVDEGAYFMTWKLEGETCEAADISLLGQSYGLCGGSREVGQFVSPERAGEALYFFGTYAPFDTSTPAGTLNFHGQGLEKASPSQQRMIAEWARLVAREAAAGSSDASWGAVFTWNRTGGLAGFCDNVTVYLTGMASVSSCKSNQPIDGSFLRLTSEELDQLYSWVDTLASFEDTYQDPAPVDGISLELVFTGMGSASPTVEQKEAINQFASTLYVEAVTRGTPGSEQDAAQLALSDFFLALGRGDYQAAIDLYGGSYEVLRGYNSNIPSDDLVALFKAGCEFSGLVCNLTVGNVLEVVQVTEDTFQFTVQFINAGGELFQVGPCCGADPGSSPPTTRFPYTVQKVDGRYLVQDLPPYIP